jgi:Ca2+-binding RTX toxin-like protein
MATVGSITLDGDFTDWNATDEIDRPGNAVSGYHLFGKLAADPALGDTYIIGFESTSTSNPVIGANTTLWLNTDQNASTGYQIWGSAGGAEYYVNWVADANNVVQPYLYNASGALVSATPLTYAASADGKSFELAIPRAELTFADGSAPKSINVVADVNDAVFLPGSYANNPQYTITDPSTLAVVDHSIKKVGIVWSDTSANLYFSKTAYSDLFMAAQHQAEAAGVSYDILTEADLTNVGKLAQYSALVFPSMADVKAADLPAITSALTQAVYDYHVGIITAGNFLTNDETGAPLTGDSYAQMKSLLDLTRAGGGSDTYTVTPDDLGNPIMKGYAAGQIIGGSDGQIAGTTAGVYTNAGYSTYTGVTKTADVLADINLSNGTKVAGVVETTTGGTNVHFATEGLMGDSNLLQHAIQDVVYGAATPSVALQMTRSNGIVASRTDMDQSQFITDVSPVDANGASLPGIYDKLLPILQQWNQQYDFVGSYFISVGDGTTAEQTTNWAVSAPYYQQLIAMGNEIGNHSYTHLINPPAGSPATWAENTNYLNTTGTGPWTFDYEFNQSKLIEQQNIGVTIAGVAVPGMPETLATAEQILQYYQSIAGGVTGYVTGGWTGVGSGYPNAFGYMTPTDAGPVYLAPNMTFDFTEIGFEGKTAAQALADWIAQFDKLSANSSVPVIVWPWHDYGAAAWDTSGTGAASPYTTQMYTDFIAYAYSKGFEFVTEEDLAARIAAQQKATITTTTSGSTINVTVTPDPSAPDVGKMALNVINGGSQVIQNVTNWYAYDSTSVFLPRNGGSFAVNLGTTQDDVTHIASLPMRADLLSVTGDGSNLSFSITGDGAVLVDLKAPGAQIVSVQGAPTGNLSGSQLDQLTLVFADAALAISATSPTGTPVQHDVTITEGASAVATAGADLIFGGSSDDTLSGGGGNDYLNGGGGVNTAVYTGLISDYTVTRNSDGSVTLADTRTGTPDGTDTDANVQYFKFADGLVVSLAQLTTITWGTAGADILTSANASQLIIGLAGNDTLTAGAANQILDGGAGADILNDGGTAIGGVTTMVGGADNDVYIVTKASDVVTEIAGGGVDAVQTALAAFTLPGNVENLTFTGAGAFTGTGNELANVITGGAGNDTLDGGLNATGGDRLVGGSGADTYVVNNTADVVVESVNGGTDTVISKINSYTLGSNVENLTFTGAGAFTGVGNTLANTITGGAGDDTLTGGGGADVLDGGGGVNTAVYSGLMSNYAITPNANGGVSLRDTRFGSPDGTDTDSNIQYFRFSDGLIVSLAQLTGTGVTTGTSGADILTSVAAGQIILGLAGNDVLTAGAADQTLDGGAGADTLNDGGASVGGVTTMVGGAGNDAYIATKASDVIVELAGAGADTIQTTLHSFALQTNVENLTSTGTGDFTGTGNSAANTITGGAGNDTLDGGLNTTGRDHLVGGLGADTYIVNNASDVVTEAASAGTDTVLAKVSSYTLSANVENLTYTGSGAFTGTGNGLANTLTGGAGADTLNGGGGADRLIGGAGDDHLAGGAGADTFVFNPVNPVSGNVGFGNDVITDFTVRGASHDVLDLSASLFSAGATAASVLDTYAHQVGTNTVITIDAHDTITLNNISLTLLKQNLADIHLV